MSLPITVPNSIQFTCLVSVYNSIYLLQTNTNKYFHTIIFWTDTPRFSDNFSNFCRCKWELRVERINHRTCNLRPESKKRPIADVWPVFAVYVRFTSLQFLIPSASASVSVSVSGFPITCSSSPCAFSLPCIVPFVGGSQRGRWYFCS